jgi:hypothetical protein
MSRRCHTMTERGGERRSSCVGNELADHGAQRRSPVRPYKAEVGGFEALNAHRETLPARASDPRRLEA